MLSSLPPEAFAIAEDRSNTTAAGGNFGDAHKHTRFPASARVSVRIECCWTKTFKGKEKEGARERGVPPLAAAMWL